VELPIPPWPVGIMTLEKPDDQPSGATVHRPRARGCETVGEEKIASAGR
jgi:hypothetical protein